MKKLLIVCLFLATSAIGQELASFSKIRLKNGSEFTAQIVENHPGDFIKIKLGEGQFSTIKYGDIASIKDKNYQFKSEFRLEKGLFAETAFAFMFGKSGELGDVRVGMSLGATGNYRFNPYLALGAGVEINTLYVNSDFFLVPIYARISGSFSERRVVPYYMLDLGWSSASTGEQQADDYEMSGGLFVRPEIGIRFNKVRVGFAYQNQQVRTSYANNFWWSGEQLVEEKRIMRNIRMGVSVIF